MEDNRGARKIKKRSDQITLDHGKHEINVDLGFQPARVTISLVEDGEDYTPVCSGNIDYVSYTLTRSGFILYADITSTKRTVYWHARL